jgi:hypothetical protein
MVLHEPWDLLLVPFESCGAGLGLNGQKCASKPAQEGRWSSLLPDARDHRVLIARPRGWFVQMCRPQVSVMCSGVVFAEAVGLVESAFVPGGVELPLPCSVACPTESHAHGFGSLLLD